ncbi:hypothetical protein Pcinc_001766 [Petrolisthes cinctipes]|uniref:Sulfotransferase domain-containing protein n=1 Tax=Petrolisthes cinctipes TaxID=88211 RepID=A0AAE1GR08_PETCI|nr:hypothetical protein Pcinc_001766 [Petrolisthes cinctipes]
MATVKTSLSRERSSSGRANEPGMFDPKSSSQGSRRPCIITLFTHLGLVQSTFTHGLVRILPDGWLYPATTPRFFNRIQSFKFRPDDVIVMTFPKSGTTWMQEILWTMLFNPNLDNPQAT